MSAPKKDEPAPAPETDAPPDVFGGTIGSDQVPVVDRIGQKTHIPASQYATAMQRGYRFQTPEEQDEYARHLKYGGLGQQAKAGLEGVARGLTLGLSDVAEKGLHISDAGDIRGRQEENPITAGVGEVAGAILPEFIPGVGEVMLPKLATKAGKLGAKALGLTEEVGVGARIAEEAAKAAKLAEEGGLLEHTLGNAAKLGAELTSEEARLPLGKRLLGKVVAGGIEGSLFGLGNSVSEASLGDPDLNAQKLVANWGLGAIMGAAGGGAGGLLEEAAGPALGKLAKSMEDVEGGLHGLSNEMTLKATGATMADLQKVARSQQREVGAMMRERGHVGGNATETLESIQKDAGETSQRIGAEMGVPEVASGKIGPDLVGGKDGAGVAVVREALDTHGARIGDILEGADAAGAQVNFNHARSVLRNAAIDDLNPVQERLAKPLLESMLSDLTRAEEKGSGFKALNAIKSSYQHDINYMADSGEMLVVKKRLVGILTKEIDEQLAPQIGGDLAKQFLDSKKTYGLLATGLEALEKNGSRGTDAIAAMLERSGLDSADAKTFGLLAQAERFGIKGANRAAGNRTFSLGDRLKGMVGAGVGGMLGGPLGAIVGMKAGEIAERFARTRGPAFVALASDWITKTPALLALAEHFGHSAGKVVANLGEFGPIMSSALASGPARAMATHLMLSREDPAYRERAALAGFPMQTGAEEGASLDRAHQLETAKLALREQDRQTELHIGHVLKGERAPKVGASASSQDFGAKSMRRESVAGHERHTGDVMALAADPHALAERVSQNTAGLGDHAPATTAALSAVAGRAVSFLASKASKPPKGGPLAQKWHPSSAEVAKFGRYQEATQDPASALRHAAAGTLTPEHVEALKAVYPAYLAHLQASILDRLMDNPKSVPYRARVSLALLGVDPDGSFSAGSIQRAQAVFSHPSSRDSAHQASAGKPVSLKGADRLTVAARSQTRSQATEAREG